MKTSLIFLILILCSCQSPKLKMWKPHDLIIKDEVSLKFPSSITDQEAREDIDYLIYALDTAYGGRNYLLQETFQNAKNALKNIPTFTSMENFHQEIDSALFLIPDNHLMAYYKGNISKIRKSSYKKSSVGKNAISDSNKVWEVKTKKIGLKNILYISITRFPNYKNKIWNNFIDSVAKDLKKSNAIILDLRGNTGGDDQMGISLAELLFGHPIEHPIKRQYRSQTPETFALKVNTQKVYIKNIQMDEEKVPTDIEQELIYQEENFKKALNNEISPLYTRTDKGTGSRLDPITGFKKPIYILMDSECGSSCEFTIAAFEWHPYVKRVGENTRGTFHFSNAAIAVLPNSKFKVMIPTQHSEYFDKRFIERVGFSPDIKVESGKDALDITENLIKSSSN